MRYNWIDNKGDLRLTRILVILSTGWVTPLSAVHTYSPASDLVTLDSDTLSPPPDMLLPVSYLRHDTRGTGLPLASQIMFKSSPAVTSSVLSHAWISGGTEIQPNCTEMINVKSECSSGSRGMYQSIFMTNVLTQNFQSRKYHDAIKGNFVGLSCSLLGKFSRALSLIYYEHFVFRHLGWIDSFDISIIS